MDLKRGLIVLNKAGRDKGRFFVVMEAYDKEALICDGKYRKLDSPKKKNIKHLAATKTVLLENEIETNKKLRKALRAFNS